MAQETGIEPKPVLPALTYLRLAFQADMPHLFFATVEVDVAYFRPTMEEQETSPTNWCHQTW